VQIASWRKEYFGQRTANLFKVPAIFQSEAGDTGHIANTGHQTHQPVTISPVSFTSLRQAQHCQIIIIVIIIIIIRRTPTKLSQCDQSQEPTPLSIV
jgi:hypothetical protein